MLDQSKAQRYSWLLVKNPKRPDIAKLRDKYHILDDDLRSTLPPVQRAQFIDRENYDFLVLQYPYYDSREAEILHSEIDFFVGSKFLVCVTDGKLTPLLDYFTEHRTNPELLPRSAEGLLLDVLEHLTAYLAPLLNHIAADIDGIEDKILDDSPTQRVTIFRMLSLKRNVVNFKRIIHENESVLNKLAKEGSRQFRATSLQERLETLAVLSGEASNTLSNYRETIDALDETHESLLNFRTNEVMKTLTVFAVIVFPLTLLAGIFGMNAINMPLVNEPYGFLVIIAIMLLGAISLWTYFKHKGWI